MKLDIFVYKLGETIVTEKRLPVDETYTRKRMHRPWDIRSYNEDEKFYEANHLCELVHYEDERGYFRPIDLEETKQWVKDNIQFNQDRWFNILEDMENDDSLAFCFKWRMGRKMFCVYDGVIILYEV